MLREISEANEPQSRLGPQGQSSKMGTWSLLLINNPGTAEYGFGSLKIKVQILALPLPRCDAEQGVAFCGCGCSGLALGAVVRPKRVYAAKHSG